ncbi:MAG: tetratricopeptide repeat protein [Paludibacter sp.]|nr:tetratricopeptide repeat protein [Paludibacter sp.]
MKKSLIAILTFCFSFYGVGQVKETKKTEKLLKELSDNGCKCIDSIKTTNKTKEEISKDINRCINAQAGAYQLGSKMMEIDLASLSKKDSKDTVKIVINSNEESKEYKDYYYEIERYMMINCKSIKRKIASSDLENYFSMSKNPEAKKLYHKGIDQSEKQNYQKAISYFEKALKIDSLFAFAWDNMGLCYRKLDKYDDAIFAYNKSLELDPLGLMPLQNIAVAYKYKKEYQKALAAYETLAELDSKNPEVYYGIGLLYAYSLNDLEKGLDNICKAYTYYIAQKSPYRTDAEKLINMIYVDMKKQGKETVFDEILKKNNINQNSK